MTWIADMAAAASRINHLLSTPTAQKTPDDSWVLGFGQTLMPMLLAPSGQSSGFANVWRDSLLNMKVGMETTKDKSVRDTCAILLGLADGWFPDQLSFATGFDFDEMFGEGGELCRESTELYEYDAHHSRMLQLVNSDPFLLTAGAAWPLALHYGDLEGAHADMAARCEGVQRSLAEPSQGGEYVSLFATFSFGSSILFHLLGCGDQWAEVCESGGATWADGEKTMDRFVAGAPMCRPRGSTDARFLATAESSTWAAKYSYLLCSGFKGVQKAEVAEAMPSPAQIDVWSVCQQDFGPAEQWFQFTGVLGALVAEQIGKGDTALEYVSCALADPIKSSGDPKILARCTAYCVKGRVLSKRGDAAAAEAAFEAAVDEGQKWQRWLLVAIALRDLHALLRGENMAVSCCVSLHFIPFWRHCRTHQIVVCS